ncbi:ABC-three component system protein [Rodentibacter pneumotropicus]|nr:ABC-three component system protein [Rodentibacter pneumotropicus]TGZ98066.1 hypothetical protein D3M79_10820 [Rodentibacter pneumotropicus]
MLSNNQKISNKGNNNQIAGGDINNIITMENKKDAAITRILNDLSKVIDQEVSYQTLVLGEYTIEEKIDYNNIEIYKDDLEEYMDFYYRIEEQINIYLQTDPIFLQKITQYIKSIYRRCNPKKLDSDTVISEMENKINEELINYTGIKSLDELSYITYFVFYIFAKCKIFRKPIKNHVT